MTAKGTPIDTLEGIRERLWEELDKAVAERDRAESQVHKMRLALQALEPKKERKQAGPIGRPTGQGQVQLALLDAENVVERAEQIVGGDDA